MNRREFLKALATAALGAGTARLLPAAPVTTPFAGQGLIDFAGLEEVLRDVVQPRLRAHFSEKGKAWERFCEA